MQSPFFSRFGLFFLLSLFGSVVPSSIEAQTAQRRPVSPTVIEVAPNAGFEATARQQLIRSTIDRGDLEVARKLLIQDLKRVPKDPENLFLMARLEILQGRRAEGKSILEAVWKLKPSDPVYRRALASINEEDARKAMSQREYAAATIAWKNCLALKHKPRDSERLLNETYRAWASHFLASGKPQEAERVLLDGLRQLPDQPGLRLDLANLLIAADRLDEARRELKELVEANPIFADGLVSFARVLHRAGESREALKCLERALSLAPTHEEALKIRQEITRESPDLEKPGTRSSGISFDEPDQETIQRLSQLESQGNLIGQVEVLKKHLASNPSASWACLRLAMVNERQGKPVEALELVGQYLQNRPDDVRGQFLRARCLHLTGDLQGSFHALKALEAEGKGTLQVLDEIGQVLAKMGKFEPAEKIWNRILSEDPSYSGALFHLGQLTMERGDSIRAQGFFNQALKQEPYNLKFRFFAGLNLKQSGKLEEAKVLWGASRAFLNLQDPYGVRLARALGEEIPSETVTDLNTKQVSPPLPAGGLILRAEPDIAEEDADHVEQPGTSSAQPSVFAHPQPVSDQVSGAATDFPPGTDLYKAALEAARAGRFEQAITGFRQVLAQKPDDFNTVVNLGNAYLASGRPTEAAAQYLRGVTLSPENTYILKAAARALDDLGLKGRTAELSARLAEIKPDSAEGLTTFGPDGVRPRSNPRSFEPVIDALLNSGQLDEARHLIKIGNDENPENCDLWLLSGDIWLRSGKQTQAESAYQKALELDRQNLFPYIKLGELYSSQGKVDRAKAQFDVVLTSKHSDPRSLLLLGSAFQRLGNKAGLRDVANKLQGMNLSESQLEQLKGLQNSY